MHRRFYPISIILAVVLVLLGQASAAPTPTLLRRQAIGNTPSLPFTTQTVQTTQTDAGPVTETCTFTFTQVTGSDGEPLVQVVRACTETGGAPPPPNDPGSATSSPPPALTSASTSTSTSTPPPQTSASPPPATSPPDSSTPTDTTSTPGSSATPLNPVFSSVALSTISTPSPPPSPSPTPTSATGPSSSPAPASSQPVSTSPASTGTVSPDTAPDTTPSSDATATPQGAFQIPGKKISVLPIGLGIFAGISVIALIVVGLVTYERTKYRKIFRARKLAEMGSAPGFGGMGS